MTSELFKKSLLPAVSYKLPKTPRTKKQAKIENPDKFTVNQNSPLTKNIIE